MCPHISIHLHTVDHIVHGWDVHGNDLNLASWFSMVKTLWSSKVVTVNMEDLSGGAPYLQILTTSRVMLIIKNWCREPGAGMTVTVAQCGTSVVVAPICKGALQLIPELAMFLVRSYINWATNVLGRKKSRACSRAFWDLNNTITYHYNEM